MAKKQFFRVLLIRFPSNYTILSSVFPAHLVKVGLCCNHNSIVGNPSQYRVLCVLSPRETRSEERENTHREELNFLNHLLDKTSICLIGPSLPVGGKQLFPIFTNARLRIEARVMWQRPRCVVSNDHGQPSLTDNCLYVD